MPSRGVSPTPSDAEVDILGSIYPGDDADDGQNAMSLDADFGDLINAPGGDGDDGDEAFIALQQAASYRKASNLKGRTVKKGGGFQAMGMFLRLTTCAVPHTITDTVARPQRQPPQGHHTKGILRPYPDSAKDDPPRSRQERCRRHGQDRFRKDGCLRDTHD